MSTDYYKNLWTTTQGKGAQFFKNVNFNIAAYQYQEKIFKAYLRDLSFKEDIRSVLELGAGTGRMTKIMLEELPNIDLYQTIDISNKIGKKLSEKYNGILYTLEYDLIEFLKGPQYCIFDLIFASEVFMHIKPKDIDYIISRLSKIGKQIINIDWTFNPDPNAGWYFIHDYEKLYERYGAHRVTRVDMKRIQQSLFHYRWD